MYKLNSNSADTPHLHPSEPVTHGDTLLRLPVVTEASHQIDPRRRRRTRRGGKYPRLGIICEGCGLRQSLERRTLEFDVANDLR